jgi:hypothetical protein
VLGKQNCRLTQVDILSNPTDPSSPHITLSHKEDIESQILQRNRRHSLQALSTPFMANKNIRHAIIPSHELNLFNVILSGQATDTLHDFESLNDTERTWMQSPQSLVTQEISLHLSLKDFKQFFKSKQEKTVSLPSGHHIGHYKVAIEGIWRDSPIFPDLIISIAQISLLTATPLDHWNKASQVMLEKGEGKFIEYLCIIQLCEAELNFVLHIIWGHRPLRPALKFSALDNMQNTLPGQTCNNAVLNKHCFLIFPDKHYPLGP